MRPWEWSAEAKVAAVQLLCDGVLTALVVARVPYTEIDFEAYMQQVSQIAQGERNYGSISGSTGPLVYPAGFAWLFLAIQHATGGSVALAQRLFACLYLASTALALAFSASAHSVPTAALPLLSSSKRFHSIFTLRLFNDAVVCFLTNASLAIASFYSLVASSIVLSLAVSVKMNALLLLPPLAVLMLKRCSLASIALSALSFVAMQLALALPFLLHSPISYFSSAFDLSRDFLYEWSVNWQFVPEPIFHSTFFSRSLLALHLVSLFLLAHFKWCSDQPHGLLGLIQQRILLQKPPCRKMTTGEVAHTLAEGNFAGIVFARTLHYQFYAWYAQQLPLLVWGSALPSIAKIAVIIGIETCWNLYPPRASSSALLFSLHLLVLASLFFRRSPLRLKSKQKAL